MLAEAGGRENDASRRDEIARLEKTAKGLLNRMGESNIEGILNEVEGLYRKHARNGSSIAKSSCSSRRRDSSLTLSLERFRRHLLPHQTHPRNHLLPRQPPRLFRRSLRVSRCRSLQDHRNRVRFVLSLDSLLLSQLLVSDLLFLTFTGASFIQTLVQTLSTYLDPLTSSSSSEEQEPLGKEPSNLITLLAELYNFQVVSCVLVYDLIRTFLEGGLKDERQVELLLKVVRSESRFSSFSSTSFGDATKLTFRFIRFEGSGPQLRSDDPTALKDIIQIVQEKTAGMDTATMRFVSSSPLPPSPLPPRTCPRRS